MPRDYKDYLKDILDSIEKIQKHTANIHRGAFLSETLKLEYVNRKLGIIGEAANKIPQNIQELYPSVEWKKIIGVRNIIIHEYNRVNRQIIWDIIQNDLPILEEKIRKIIRELEEK